MSRAGITTRTFQHYGHYGNIALASKIEQCPGLAKICHGATYNPEPTPFMKDLSVCNHHTYESLEKKAKISMGCFVGRRSLNHQIRKPPSPFRMWFHHIQTPRRCGPISGITSSKSGQSHVFFFLRDRSRDAEVAESFQLSGRVPAVHCRREGKVVRQDGGLK